MRYKIRLIFVIVGIVMVIGSLIKLFRVVNFSSDWFWFLAGMGLVVEGTIAFLTQKRFPVCHKAIIPVIPVACKIMFIAGIESFKQNFIILVIVNKIVKKTKKILRYNIFISPLFFSKDVLVQLISLQIQK